MGNMVTYAQEILDHFAARPFGSVDSLILSWVSYMHFPEEMEDIRGWEGRRMSDLLRAEYYPGMFADLWNPEGNRELLAALAASPRFRDIRLCGYVEQLDREAEKQFAAVTFKIHPGLSYVAFRGTDATLVGWKEDFNMAFQYPVPAQASAEEYLALAACRCRGELLLGGHSKGGNLSVYAAAHASDPTRERIGRVFSHDGPGFQEHVLSSPQFARILPKVEKTLPQSSLVGMLLENQEDYLVVKSKSISLYQHDPFSWQVEQGAFCTQDSLTAGARYRDDTMNEWIRELPPGDREKFVDALFEVLEVHGIDTMSEFNSDLRKNIPAALTRLSSLDAQTRELVFAVLGKLAALALKNFPDAFKNAPRFPRKKGKGAKEQAQPPKNSGKAAGERKFKIKTD